MAGAQQRCWHLQGLPCNLQVQGALTDSPWWSWGGERSLSGTAEGSFVRAEGLGMQKVVNISPGTQLLWTLEAHEQWDRREQLCP